MSTGDRNQQSNVSNVSVSTATTALKATLEKYKPQLSRALPAHMDVDQFLSVVNGAVSKNPSIADCEMGSVLQSVGQAARMGLNIDTLGHGFLVPYNDTKRGIKICQFIPGWQGLVDLVNRSGRGIVKTGAVFAGDFFEYDLGLDAFLRHRNEGAETTDKLLYVYSIGYIRGEGGWTPPPILEVWKSTKVEMHFAHYNKVGKSHYALRDGNNWVQYAKKLPLLQVLKYMPKSTELSKAIEAANRADSGETFTMDGDFVLSPESGAGNGAGPQVTYAQLADRINAAKTRDAVDLILDEARTLPADQTSELVALADKKFPRAA